MGSKTKITCPIWIRSLIFLLFAVIIPVILLFTTIHMTKKNAVIVKRLVSHSDMIPIEDRMSSVWCSGQRISSLTNPFNVFVVKSKLEVNSQHQRQYRFRHELDLFRGEGIALAFYLLANSSLKITANPKLDGAVINVVEGENNLKYCVAALTASDGDVESFEFEDLMGDESSVSSSEQAVVMNPSMSMICNDSIQSVHLSRKYRQKYDADVFVRSNSSSSYFVLFSTNNIIDIIPNRIELEIIVERTGFRNVHRLKPTFKNVTSCEVKSQIGADDKVVVEIPAPLIDDDSNFSVYSTDILTNECKPRREIYLAILIPVLVMIMYAGFCC